MTVLHEFPFAIADYVGLRRFIKNLQSLYAIKCSKTIKTDIMKLYDEEKLKMYATLERIVSRISVTSDMWTSCQNRGYMSLTTHYIDDDWKLQKRIINFLQVKVPHNAERLSETIMTCLMEWNIDGKLFAMSLDNCTVNDCMVNNVIESLKSRGVLLGDGKFFHVRCAAHILNLIVQDGWKALGGSSKDDCLLGRIRQSVKFVVGSQKKEQIFNEVVKQVHISYGKSLILDCPTRWNSTYDMLIVALEYKEAFSRLQYVDKDYKIAPSKEEWIMARVVADCLKIFLDVTRIFSGTKYPTSNIFFGEICKVNCEISKWQESPHEFIRTMANAMRPEFDKYWSICHPPLAIATFLDPQYKLKLVEFYFKKIHGETLAKFEVQVMKDAFEDLYSEYQMNSSSNISLKVTCGDCNGDDGVEGDDFDLFIQETSMSQCRKSDWEYYLDEPVIPRSKFFDILAWWKANESKYPILSQMARDILCIPVSTVASESAFSTGGRVLDKYRSSLAPDTVQALLCTQDWIRDEFIDYEKNMVASTSSHVGSNDISMGGDVDSNLE